MDLEQKILQTTSNLNPETVGLITEAINRLWTALWWVAGTCVSGFFVLLGWCWRISGRLTIVKEIVEMNRTLKKIEIALIGDFEKKGLLTKHRELERRLDDMEKSKRFLRDED